MCALLVCCWLTIELVAPITQIDIVAPPGIQWSLALIKIFYVDIRLANAVSKCLINFNNLSLCASNNILLISFFLPSVIARVSLHVFLESIHEVTDTSHHKYYSS